LPLDNSDFNSNAWLAGFTDADGNFSIKFSGISTDSDLNTRGRVITVFLLTKGNL
jgi:hypothetical protein